MLPKSFQRTDSTGQLNVFILLKKKLNDDFIIVSRENLPPTLRNGKLVLNQKITIRDEERNSIEGVIVYMHSDRDNCVAFEKQLKNHELQHMNASNSTANFSKLNPSSLPRVNVGSKLSKDISKKSSVPPPIQTEKKSKTPSSNKKLVEAQFPSSPAIKDNEDESNNNNISSNGYSSPLLPINLDEDDIIQTPIGPSMIIQDQNENNLFIDKINELSAKVLQQKTRIKELENELKRVRATTIEIPTEPAAQDYIRYVADVVRQNTIEYKYIGNLTNDAITLGIKPVQLNEFLNSKGGITSIARELFKTMIPEKKRSVKLWNDLPEDVLIKEKLLIGFLERYYGPLRVDQKKIHISLVGCLRNDRGKQKKMQQLQTLYSDDNLEEVNGIED